MDSIGKCGRAAHNRVVCRTSEIPRFPPAGPTGGIRHRRGPCIRNSTGPSRITSGRRVAALKGPQRVAGGSAPRYPRNTGQRGAEPRRVFQRNRRRLRRHEIEPGDRGSARGTRGGWQSLRPQSLRPQSLRTGPWSECRSKHKTQTISRHGLAVRLGGHARLRMVPPTTFQHTSDDDLVNFAIDRIQHPTCHHTRRPCDEGWCCRISALTRFDPTRSARSPTALSIRVAGRMRRSARSPIQWSGA